MAQTLFTWIVYFECKFLKKKFQRQQVKVRAFKPEQAANRALKALVQLPGIKRSRGLKKGFTIGVYCVGPYEKGQS